MKVRFLISCYQLLLKEMDDEISDDELDEIIFEVSFV